MKALRIRSIDSLPWEVAGLVTLKMKSRTLWRKVEFLAVPQPATNGLLEVALVGYYIDRISREASLITQIDSRLVEIANGNRRDHVMTISVDNATKENRNLADWNRCVATRGVTVFSMSAGPVLVTISSGNIQLERAHKNLVLNRTDLVAQGMVDTASEVPSLIKIENLSLSCTVLIRGVNVT